MGYGIHIFFWQLAIGIKQSVKKLEAIFSVYDSHHVVKNHNICIC